jgi:hypothetical protein
VARGQPPSPIISVASRGEMLTTRQFIAWAFGPPRDWCSAALARSPL